MARAATREDLRAALWSAPTPAQFDRVLKVLFSMERRPDFRASEYESQILRMAGEALDGWPAHARRAPEWLLDRVERREPVRGARLVRSLEISQEALAGRQRLVGVLLSRMPLGRLRELSLQGLSDSYMEEVLGQLRLCEAMELEMLSLRECLMFSTLHRGFADALSASSVRRLTLDRVLMEGVDLEPWTQGSSWGRLRELTIANSALGQQGLYTLAQTQMFALERLSVERSDVMGHTLYALLSQETSPRLKHLGLSGNRGLRRNTWDVLCVHDIGTLESIDLSDTNVLQELERTERVVWRTPPTRLGLRNTGLGPESVRPLLDRLPEGLTSLDLDDNPMGGDEMELMLGGEQLASLTSLSLGGLDAQAWAKTLPALRPLRRLTSLRLSTAHPERERSMEGVRALSNLERLGDLEHLDVSGWRLEEEGLAALLGGRARFSLRSLKLRQCHLTDASIEVICRAGLDALEVLDLGGNQLTSRALLSLASLSPGLRVLHADGCFDAIVDERARRALVVHMASLGVEITS